MCSSLTTTPQNIILPAAAAFYQTLFKFKHISIISTLLEEFLGGISFFSSFNTRHTHETVFNVKCCGFRKSTKQIIRKSKAKRH